MTELGPVSASLEAELRELARQHGIVVWLDNGPRPGRGRRWRAWRGAHRVTTWQMQAVRARMSAIGQMMGFPGASWWKLDVHTHTPASTDFGKGSSNQSQLRKILPMDWLLAFMRAGVDAVVVTDHNSGAWIERTMIPDSLGDRRNGPGHRRGTRGQCRLVRRGSLQSRDVRDQVCAMMEGGRETLEKRYPRIIDEDDHV